MKKIVLVVVVAMSLLLFSSVHAQEISNPDLPIVRCAGLMCTEPLAFFEYRVYMPMIGGN